MKLGNRVLGKTHLLRSRTAGNGRGKMLRVLLMSGVALGAVVSAPAYAQDAPAQVADAGSQYQFNIPAQSLESALLQFSEVTGIQLFIDSALVSGIESQGVSGNLIAEQALVTLLSGTGIGYEFTTDNSVTLERVATSSPANAANTETTLDPIFVTASSRASTVKDAPASVSVITHDDLARNVSSDVTEVLRKEAGLNVGFGSDGTKGISIRGLGSDYTLIMVDGKRVNAQLTTLRHYNGDLGWIPEEAIERIEIVRGPMSTLYGSDAVGGVVNIITRDARDYWSGSVTTEWIEPEDSNTGATKSLNGYVAGPLVSDKLYFTGYANARDEDPNEDPDVGGNNSDGSRDYDASGRFTWMPDDKQTIDLELGYGEERYDPYLAPGETDSSKTKITRGTASLQHVGDWDFGTTTITAYTEQASNEGNHTDRSGALLTNSIDVASYTLDGKVSMPTEILVKQDLTLGGEYRYEELDDAANLGMLNTVTGTTGSPTTDLTTFAVFAEDQFHLTDAFTLTAGLRMDHHEEFGEHFSPRLYGVYKVDDAWRVKAGWAQAYKAPDLRELNPNWVTRSRGRGCGAVGGPCEMVGNADLDPETSDNYEIGFTYDDHGVSGGLTYFYNEIEDKITSAREPTLVLPDGTVFVQRINVDEARTQGFEGNLNLPIHRDWDWNNSFTWLIESKNLETGEPLVASPELAFNSAVTWYATDRLTLDLGGSYYSKQVDYEGSPETLTAQVVDPYYIVNLGLSYDATDDMTLRAGINNLTDNQPSSDSNYKEDGRAVYVSMTSRF
ncbi:TonB-dependent receptor [Thalassospira sp. MA62]|nr:TonB-dependent receptor [Thalassospira sp. MA62]